jgi:NAD(P)-dependent dehydrogenase (short-subunit alcohol dehydrogenase family)
MLGATEEARMDVAGKTAVITGGASGIGLATARRLAGAGAKLVLGDVEAGPLADAVKALEADGASVVGVPCDVASLADVERLRDEALSAFGAVHVVFNNAGVGGGPTLGSPIEMWRWVSSVNLDGVVHGVHTFLPLLLDQDEGHVVNTASLAGLGGVPGMGPYCATKFAVVGLSESLFYDLALRHSAVHVSVLCPGLVRTRIAESGRNMPAGLAALAGGEPDGAIASAAAAAVASGIDPGVVADHVADAIADGTFWVLPHRHVALRTTEQRLGWMQGGPPAGIDLEKAARGG